MMFCAESKAINDPKVLLQKVLDPPDPETVEEALDLLVHIHALEKPQNLRGRYEPTFHGRLLDSLPLSFDASVLALKFGEIGLIREGILISILMDIQPLPIDQPFGCQMLSMKYVDNFFGGDSTSTVQGGKETVLIGNLCAFQFWQHVFKDKHRLDRLKQITNIDEPKASQSMICKPEEEWCSFHNLVQTSLHNVSEIYEDIVHGIIHRFRPEFFSSNKSRCYRKPYAFKHTCLLQSELVQDMATLTLEDENTELVSERRCLAAPYVTKNDFQAITIFEKLKTLIKERCRSGASCFFSHAHNLRSASIGATGACSPENDFALPSSFLEFLPPAADARVLLFNDKDLVFTSNISHLYDPAKIIATTPHAYSVDLLDLSNGAKVLWNVTNPCYSILESKGEEDLIPWNKVCSVIWFPEIDTNESDIPPHLLQSFFELLAIRVLAETLYDMHVIITMNNMRFAQLKVERRIARECFFSLARSFPFDEHTFGNLFKECGNPRPMQVSAPISYVFKMLPPWDVQFGNYSSVLYNGLHHSNK